MSSSSRVVGIDLGTTNSAVSILDESGAPTLIPNSVGKLLTPSVVAVDDAGHVLVGAEARELRVTRPERCASLFKRQMGNDVRVRLGDREFSPEELSSLVLRSLKQDAEAALGEAIDRAVITCPAYFNEHQRKATIQAGRLAGLHVERIFNEPTAAAVAYGFHELSKNEQRVLVILDLGGGTFDVTLVELFEGVLEVRASSGETILGGEDFSLSLAGRVLGEFGQLFERAEVEHPRQVSRLVQQCEQAKCRLSYQHEAPVRVPRTDGTLDDDCPTLSISRADLERWCQPLMARLEGPVRRALGDAGLKPHNVDEVILVGGATRMPMVIDWASRLFGKTPHSRIDPDHVVALGAGVQAALIARHAAVEEMVVTDVAAFTMGVETLKEFGHELRPGYYLPIIHRNTTIPASRVQQVCTVRPNQTRVDIKVYQGENRRVQDNLLLGELSVDGIPRGPAGQPIEIRFTYDLNGVLEVEATIAATGRKFSCVITRHAKSSMSQADIQLAVEQMQKLKMHPREDAPNRFLIRRAERLYQELPIHERETLEMLLTGFEESLDLGDRDAVARNREALAEFLDRFDSMDADEA